LLGASPSLIHCTLSTTRAVAGQEGSEPCAQAAVVQNTMPTNINIVFILVLPTVYLNIINYYNLVYWL
jgi:hypothetical protein